MAEITVTGLTDLNRLLQDLPVRLEANVLRGALRAGANVIAEEARRRCPVGAPSWIARRYGATPGELRRSIRVTLRSRRGLVKATVTAGNRKAFYAHLVEYGTAGHWIRPKNRKSLFVAGLLREAVEHPGAARHPFLRPALDLKSQDAVQRMAEYVRARLPREFAKIARAGRT